MALVALPEPFTTPFGLTLLLLSFVLPRNRTVDSRDRLRELFRVYLSSTRGSGCGLSDLPPVNTVYHALNREMLPHLAGAGASMAHSEHYNWTSKLTPSSKIVHHTLNRELFPIFCETASMPKANYQRHEWTSALRPSGKIVHHTLNKELLPRFSSTTSVLEAGSQHHSWAAKLRSPEKIVHHTLNRQLLPQFC